MKEVTPVLSTMDRATTEQAIQLVKSTFLQEILSNISSADVKVELSDSTRAGLLLPEEKEVEDEDLLMLLMPMMINV